MKSRTFTALLLASALALHIACADKGAETTSTDPQPVSARVSQVNYQTVPGQIEVPGTVQPRNRIILSAQLNGFVRDMHVRVGDTVRQNQLLATLDARDAKGQRAAALAAVSAAEAALAEARKSYQSAADMRTAAKAATDLATQTLTRYQKLYEARSVSPQEMDEVRTRHNTSMAEFASREAMVSAAEDRIRQAEARIEQAKAQAARADVMMSWTTLKAPADGRVVQRQADPGTAIFPGTPILVIESTARPQAVADIPSSNAALLRPGMSVRVRSAQGAVAEGKIAEIVPLSDPSTHSVQFKVDLPADFQTTTGQFVAVEVPSKSRNALLAPRTAVRETGQLTGVFVVGTDSKARLRLVKVTPYDAEHYEVLSGLESGETIVSGLNSRITDGVTVKAQ